MIPSGNRWALILAGGNDPRLRPLTKYISGDDRPKQFCPLFGGATLLEQAGRRAGRSIAASRILYSLARADERYYARLLAGRAPQCLVHPYDLGTAPAIIQAAMLIARLDPNATVAVLPSDHFYSNEDAFTKAFERSLELAEDDPDTIVLIGAKAMGPERDCGWIDPGARVRVYHGKVSEPMAYAYWRRGMLRNTGVMAGNAMSILRAVYSALPAEFKLLQRGETSTGESGEMLLDESVYGSLDFVDFARSVLAAETTGLTVQPLRRGLWSDLGDCEKALAALALAAENPAWAANWQVRGSALAS